MTDHGQSLPAALCAARRIVARESRAPSGDLALLAVDLEEICAPVLRSIRRSMGDDGCSALVGRAFVLIELEHPAGRAIRGPNDCFITRENLGAAIEAHGGAATATAVDALLASIHEILARIIGEEMAKRIIDHDLAQPPVDEGAPQS